VVAGDVGATNPWPADHRLIWFVLSLGAAVTQAAQFAVVKARARAIPPFVIVAWTQAIAFFAWLIFFVVSGHTFVSPGFVWLAIVTSAVLVMGMNALIARASMRGDISIVGPVFALSPLFTIVPDAMISGTLPNAVGAVGIALSVAGTVSLSGGAAGSLRALFTRSDALDALGAAILLGVVAAVDRWAAIMLGPPSYLLCSHGVTALLTSTIALVSTPRAVLVSFLPRNLVTVVAHGLLGVTGTGMQTTALTMAPAAYVNAIRRMSAVMAVLLGSALFREPDLGRRLAAAVLACAGAACLLLAR
jgi:drug/metabolite transporter (DMT)-like permease